MPEFKYEVDPEFDYLIEEKGNQALFFRRVSWNGRDAKPEIRKWYVDGTSETPGKGFSFMTEEGPNELIKTMTELGYGNTEEVLENAISELTGTKFTVEGFFVDNKYTTKYDFATEINGDTTIYVNVAEVATEEPTEPSEEIPADEKDETPKTGAPVYVGAAVVVAVLSLASIIVLKKKN